MTRRRSAATAVTALAVVAALFAGTGPSVEGAIAAETTAAKAPDPKTVKKWSGYPIARTGQAAGGFIGARRWGDGGPVVYLIDPAAPARRTTYQKPRWVPKLDGKGPRRFPADRRATARAAWILSKYGTFPYAIQSAAVDAAVLHLLAKHRWTLNGDRGSRRIRQSDEPAQVRKFAKIMLRDSRRKAGPYTVRVWQKNVAIVGDDVQLGIGVTVASNGRALPFVPVRVRTPDGTIKAGQTGKAGRVQLTYQRPPAGATPIVVTVGQTPETRLRLLSPRKKKASRAVIAGRKGPMYGHSAVLVKARPQVRVMIGDKQIRVGSKNKGRLRLIRSAENWPRRAAIKLHGPFAHAKYARCGIRTTRNGQRTVRSAGYYSLPRYELERKGWYVWSVRVPGNRVNLPANDCGGRFRVVGD